MAKFNNGKNVSCVVQLQKCEKAPALPADALNELGTWFFVVHDKDSKEDGEIKGLHAHLVITANDGRSSATWIDLLALLFRVGKNAVSVEITKNVRASVRYLVHKDDKTKYQYSPEEVKTNREEVFKNYLESSNKVVTNAELLACESLKEVSELIPWKDYGKAKAFWQECHSAKDANPVDAKMAHDIDASLEVLAFLIRKYQGEPSIVEDLNELQMSLLGLESKFDKWFKGGKKNA